MAAVRFTHVKRLQSSIKGSLNLEYVQQYHRSVDMNPIRISRFPSYSLSHLYSKGELQSPQVFAKNQFSSLASESHVSSAVISTKLNASFHHRLSSSFCYRGVLPFASVTHVLNCRMYSSSSGGKGGRDDGTVVAAGSGASDVNAGGDSVVGGDLAEKIKDAWKSVVDTAFSDELTPYAQQLLDSQPYLNKVVIPVGGTLTATLVAWFLMPWILRKLHQYAMKGPISLIPGSLSGEQVAYEKSFSGATAMEDPVRCLSGEQVAYEKSLSGEQVAYEKSFSGATAMEDPVRYLSGEQVAYEKSFWGAMEVPVRCLVIFMAFSQMLLALISSGAMVAPTTITMQYLAPAWRDAVITSFVWFLHRWKTNIFARTLSGQGLLGLDREKLFALDKISSVGLFVIGIMALAEACGVAVQSIVTVGGIGGVATAFAAKDILGNVFSGLSMQFWKPFSTGDTIKAGSVEGQVVEMGLTTTSLLSAEKFPVIVPNSFFSSQVIVNKSRTECRAIITKIPLQIEDLGTIPRISDDVKSMLRSHAKVFLGEDVPYCFLSRVESLYAELTLGYNLKHMRKDQLYAAEQEILLQAVQIIRNHGVALGSTWQDMNSK